MGNKSDVSDPAGPWYADGLKFTCVEDCGGCCTDHEQYAYVYLDRSTERRIAQYLKLDLATFRKRFTELDDGMRVLRMDSPDCPFPGRETVHDLPCPPQSMPHFPFLEENLSSPGAWKKLAAFCPGIDNGEHHSLRVIRKTVDKR